MIDFYTPTYSEANEKARGRFRKVVEKKIEELKAAYDEYLSVDADRSDKRKEELEQYFWNECDRSDIYCAVLKAIHLAYPKPQQQVPSFTSVGVPVVRSVEEAKQKGLTSYAIITEGPKYDVPEELKDKSIDWAGGSVTEIIPPMSDQQNPARLTYDGEAYYREQPEKRESVAFSRDLTN